MVNFSRLIRSAKRIRILFICPRCGNEAAEFVETLRRSSVYRCRGDGCGYHFDLKAGPHRELVKGFDETYARLDAIFDPAN